MGIPTGMLLFGLLLLAAVTMSDSIHHCDVWAKESWLFTLCLSY